MVNETEPTIEISLSYANNVHTLLENMVSMAFEMVSKDTTYDMTDAQRGRLMQIFNKYHNANCSSFNRHLKNKIDEAEKIKAVNNKECQCDPDDHDCSQHYYNGLFCSVCGKPRPAEARAHVEDVTNSCARCNKDYEDNDVHIIDGEGAVCFNCLTEAELKAIRD